MNRTLKSMLTWGLAAGAFVLAKGVVIGVLAATTPTAAERVDAILAQEPVASTYQAMRRHFPIEAVQLRGLMLDAYRGGRPNDAALVVLSREAGEIHFRLAEGLRAATDAEIVAILDDWLVSIAPFDSDTTACSAIAAGGLTSVQPGDPRLDPVQLAEAAERLYATMDRYRFAVDRRYVEEADFDAFAPVFLADGGTDADLAAVEARDPADPQLCGAYRRLLTSLRGAGSEGADRMRLEIVVSLFGG
ncbi:hypothetical protein [Pararhodobacter aggregans]|uniref:Uncharacterized protein n=1 Tax=Pararhodobacter aggregans TaxID=404875 RepID=A0A2T7UTS2_9RHOB|nr:hypothetical protein [Pararhodobacter aggregans]PTX02911.1 hypothetical protein C8N33_104273 [Pararhodobacter aggregans]PVE48127.1 hypothetical protein DDE23_08300 [Pararhodobacter aggregans]